MKTDTNNPNMMFSSAIGEMMAMQSELDAMTVNMFGYGPDEINYNHVGTANAIVAQMREILEAARRFNK